MKPQRLVLLVFGFIAVWTEIFFQLPTSFQYLKLLEDTHALIPNHPIANPEEEELILTDSSERTLGSLSSKNHTFIIPERIQKDDAGATKKKDSDAPSFATPTKLTSENERIPTWMKKYFSWHAQELSKLNATSWLDKKYLILACRKYERCGGLSDRLKPLPLLLLTANQTNRILLIRWDKPAKLEEFLEPNLFNWSVPEYMLELVDTQERKPGLKSMSRGYKELKKFRTSRRAKLRATKIAIFILQDMMGGQKEYENITAAINNVSVEENTDTYSNIYHDMFRYIFKPSPPVQKLIDEQMAMHGITPGQYATAHLRANYRVEDKPIKQRPRESLKPFVIKATNCASNQLPGSPIYFASDSKIAVEEALKYGKEINRTIVSYIGPDPLHIEKQWRNHSVDEFYSVFVDLHVMGSGRCTTFGVGGFGLFASLLSYNATCRYKYKDRGEPDECSWKDPVDVSV